MQIQDLGLYPAIIEKVKSMGFRGDGPVQELLIRVVDGKHSVNIRIRREEFIDLARMLTDAMNADNQYGYTDFTLTDEQRQGKTKVN